MEYEPNLTYKVTKRIHSIVEKLLNLFDSVEIRKKRLIVCNILINITFNGIQTHVALSNLLSFGLVISVIAIIFGIMFSRYFEITDHPGEHKQHQVSTPFIGGLGIIAAFSGSQVSL